ncbi:MAG: response regulator transcription factor [Gemmatimonadaceae bacterium]
MRVLVVDDDLSLGDAIVRGLRAVGMDTVLATSVADAREGLLFATHDVVVLDVMLPGGSGFELCRLMRDRGISTPVLMLTARDAVSDRVRGLDAGADDYLTKPFAFEELVARIRALARRSAVLVPDVVRVADLEVDLSSHVTSRSGKQIELTAKEFALLELFVRNEGAVLSRTMITSRVWDDNHDPFANVLEVLVSRLRHKIDDGFDQPLIHTVRGAGYRFGSAL